MSEEAIRARIEALAEMLEEDPDDELGHFMVATELSKLRDFDAAAPHFQRTIELDPSYSAAYRGLGRALGFLDRADEARAVLTRGMEIAEAAGDLQTVREMQTFLKRLGAEGAA